jgi:hypothetical protein
VEKAVELSGRASVFLSSLGYCYAVTGRRAEALTVLNELEERYARREANVNAEAEVYLGLGEKDRALAWLERGFQQHSGGLPSITMPPDLKTSAGNHVTPNCSGA